MQQGLGTYCEESMLETPPGLGWAGSEELRGKAGIKECEGRLCLLSFPGTFLLASLLLKSFLLYT